MDATEMAKIIMVTGLDQLAPTERWGRVIALLTEELECSGLGALPDLETLRREADHRGIVESTEVAVTLVNFDYGQEGSFRCRTMRQVSSLAGVALGRPCFRLGSAMV